MSAINTKKHKIGYILSKNNITLQENNPVRNTL